MDLKLRGVCSAIVLLVAAYQMELTAGADHVVKACTSSSKRFEIFCEQDKNDRPYRQKAQEFCESLNGSLANLKTRAEDDAVRNYIRDNGLDSKDCSKRGFWIGLHDGDGDDEGNYKWQDGTTPCYFNWYKGNPHDEPNNNVKQNPNGQDCAQMWSRPGKDLKWDDEYCDHRAKGIICEFLDGCNEDCYDPGV